MGVEVFGSVLFLSSLMAAPEFSDVAMKQLIRNYPTWAVRGGKSAAALVELIVESDGKVRGCSVISFVGDERLAREQCVAVMRLRLVPARAADGTPILSRYRTFLTKWIPGSGSQANEVKTASPPPDLTLKVATSTIPITEPTSLGLVLEINPAGVVTHCEGMQNSKPIGRSTVEWACAQALNFTGPVLADSAGAPAAYVMTLSVRLEPTTSS
jgi:hypothetical protein